MLAALAAVVALSFAGSAQAVSPWWHLTSGARPSHLQPEAEGELVLTATNLGNAPLSGEAVPVTIAETLPSGFSAVGIEAVAGGASSPEDGPVACSLPTLSCSFAGSLPAYDQIEVRIKVQVSSGAVSGELNRVDVSGGNAPPATAQRPLTIGGATPFGVEAFELAPEEEGGADAALAGSHPFQLTTTATLNQSSEAMPVALPKDLRFKLPPGLLANPAPIPYCTGPQFVAATEGGRNECPPQSAVGVATLVVNEGSGFLSTYTRPVFNVEPSAGEPARFGLYLLGAFVYIDTSLRDGAGGDYGATLAIHSITQVAGLLRATVTLWGSPGDPSHDSSRGWGCLEESLGTPEHLPCALAKEQHPPAFLTLPTACSGAPLSSSLEADSWAPSVGAVPPFAASPPLPTLAGCQSLTFDPSVAAAPSSSTADSPTGLDLDLGFDDRGLLGQGSRAESQIKRAVVSLPVGFAANPSVAAGLEACSVAQYESEGLEFTPGSGCPRASKLGEVAISSPLLSQPLQGAIFLAKPNGNLFPRPSLIALYLIARNPESGLLVTLPVRLQADPRTGRLTAAFDDLPELPISDLHLSFRPGPRALLATPATCGQFSATADLYPYAEPGTAVRRTATLTVDSGANGAACASSEGELPNKPTLSTGAIKPTAGAYSPFLLKISREDGSQALGSFAATLPEGVFARLAGVPYCSSMQIAVAEARGGEGGGALELASPSCPMASQVGTVHIGAGAGSQPYYVAGKAYLAGPYKGAPLSLVVVTPALAGPFDLGTVVVRVALYVDPLTAQLRAVSDRLPTILHGLPLALRSISLNLDRPSFALNPTNCDPMAVSGSATSTLGQVAPLSQRFQVGGCAKLAFKPKLSLRLSGLTHRGAHPSFRTVLSAGRGEAGLRRATIALPSTELLDNVHLRAVCSAVRFAAGHCPAGSIYGHAKAWTPLLGRPLEGPVYLRSSKGKLPDLVASLDGQIHLDLLAHVSSAHGRLRDTFAALPDAPLSKLVLTMRGGRKGLLVNTGGLCAGKLRAAASLVAHNGKRRDLQPAIGTECGKQALRPPPATTPTARRSAPPRSSLRARISAGPYAAPRHRRTARPAPRAARPGAGRPLRSARRRP